MKKGKNILFILLALVIFVGGGIFYYNYWESTTFFETENAKVTAKLCTVVPPASGKLVKFNIAKGSKVEENEVLGRVENGPYIKSPIAGEVVKCDVVLNQVVSPTVTLGVIAETGNMYVGANIEETDIAKIKVGQNVEVKLDAYPGKTFKAHVQEIDATTQSALSNNAMSFSTSGTYTKVTQLIPVKILIDDPVSLDGLIGTNATVKIRVK